MVPSVARLRAAAASCGTAAILIAAQTAAPPPAAAASAAPPDLATRVISIAEIHLGAPWVFGATGPAAFDCSGLVYSTFKRAGLLAVIGGKRTVGQMWAYFSAKGQASTTNGQPGDLVVFGNGAHIGIYMGGGRVISALVYGVAFSTLSNTIPRFRTFLHTHLYGTSAALVHHTTTATWLRAGASTAYAARAVLARGTPVWVILSSTNSARQVWYWVWLPGGRLGWVASWLVK